MKVSNDSPGRRSLGGRSFHRRGPATEKLLSPSLLCVRGTSRFRNSLESDRSGRRPASDNMQQSSARYAGVTPASDWWTSPATVNTIRCRTGSQCSCCSTSVMWSTRRAAAFCTDCKQQSSPSHILDQDCWLPRTDKLSVSQCRSSTVSSSA